MVIISMVATGIMATTMSGTISVGSRAPNELRRRDGDGVPVHPVR